MGKKSGFLVDGANESMQKTLQQGEPVIFAAYGVIGAIVLLGGAGYLLDIWLRTQPWFLVGGLVVGVCGGFYSLVRAAASR